MNAFLLRFGMLLLALLCCACLTYAQVDCFAYKALKVSRVQGQVFSPDGEPAPGVEISLKQERMEVSRATADGQGRFSMTAADGDYELRADLRGFSSAFAYINLGHDLARAFHPGKLWLMLGVGTFGPCPSSSTSHKQFLQILSDYRKQNEGLIPTYATQK